MKWYRREPNEWEIAVWKYGGYMWALMNAFCTLLALFSSNPWDALWICPLILLCGASVQALLWFRMTHTLLPESHDGRT